MMMMMMMMSNCSVCVNMLLLQKVVSQQLSGEASKTTNNANGDFADFNPRAFEAG